MMLLLARASSSLFASFLTPAATNLKLKEPRYRRRPEGQQAPTPPAAMLQTRCRSLKEKKHKRILRPVPAESPGSLASIGSLSCLVRPQQCEALTPRLQPPPPLPPCRLLQTPAAPAFPRLHHREVLLWGCLEVGCKGFCFGHCCCLYKPSCCVSADAAARPS